MGKVDGLELLVHESGTRHQEVTISDDSHQTSQLKPRVGRMSPRARSPKTCRKIHGECEVFAHSIEQHVL